MGFLDRFSHTFDKQGYDLDGYDKDGFAKNGYLINLSPDIQLFIITS